MPTATANAALSQVAARATRYAQVVMETECPGAAENGCRALGRVLHVGRNQSHPFFGAQWGKSTPTPRPVLRNAQLHRLTRHAG
jgi:hypothetical protein